MKDANIVLFKRFLRQNGMNQLFAGLYKQFRFPESPEDVEEYLRKVDARDAIINAFKFPEHLTTFGADYWLNVAVKWEQTMKNAGESGVYSRFEASKASFKHALEKPLAMPSDKDPMRKNEPVDIARQEPKTDKPVTDTRSGMTEEQAAVNNFEFIDFGKPIKGRRKLNANMLSVNRKENCACITINQEISNEIWESNLQYAHFTLLTDTNTFVMVLSNDEEKGLSIRKKSGSGNLTISNKALIAYVSKVFDLKSDLEHLRISSNKANSKEYLTYHITKFK